jgi:outer membrane protein TolC
MNMNVPLNTDRRAAAVREAQCRVTKLIAELTQQQDSVREEVQIAYSRMIAKQKALELYEDEILPAAQTNLESARAAYIAGSIDFLRVLEAVKQSIEQQIAFQRTLTEFHQGKSELERAVGTSIDGGIQHDAASASNDEPATSDEVESVSANESN